MKGRKRHLSNEYLMKCIRLSVCLFLMAAVLFSAIRANALFAPENKGVTVNVLDSDEGYTAVLYDNSNGLPTSEANDIAETEDGFIWIGSYSGLIRYDGNTFERIDSSTGITSVKCLYVDSLGRLWIGTNESGAVLMERGSFRIWSMEEGLNSTSVRDIAEDENGRIYIATSSGLQYIDADMNVQTLQDPRIDEVFMDKLEMGADGLLYALTNFGDLFTVEDGQIKTYISHEDSEFSGLNCIFPDPENPGYLYIETANFEVFYGRLTDKLTVIREIDISPLSYVTKFDYVQGRIWICARNGIGVVENSTVRKLTDVPMDNSIGRAMEDYQGNLWFTSTRQGVMKIVPNQFTDLFKKCGCTETVVNSTCFCGDDLFVGTDSGLVILNGDRQLTEYPLTKAETVSGVPLEQTDLMGMLENIRIRSIIRDRKGRIWISTWRKYGLVCYDNGEVTVYTPEDGLISDHVRTVYERGDGSFLVACTGGVNVIGNDVITHSYTEKDGIDNTEILTVCEGQNGDILMGTDGGGIIILSPSGEIRTIRQQEGLTSTNVMRIKPDSVRDIFWIVTGSSIAYLDVNYELTTIKNFPYTNNFDLYENSRGEMWVLSSNGIYVAKKKELLANERINTVQYGISNGLPCIATANSYSELSQDGILYIAGTTGVAKVNVEESFENVFDLKAAIPYLSADGKMLYPDENGVFRVPSDTYKLTVYGYVYNYSLADPYVTYLLEGFDREDTTVRRSELKPVDYTNLPGGQYSFVLRMKDPRGSGNRIVSVKIVKDKAFYEEVYFYVLSALGGILLAGLIVGLYIRRRISKLEKKHKEEVERERVSTEMQTAKMIQGSMLPHVFPPFPDRTEFDIYAVMNPAREVGGDFYDFFLIDDDHLGLVMADVSGKGIPAALFMMVSKNIVQSCAKLGHSAAEILTRTNDEICSSNQADMFVTVWVGILELSTGRLTAANAGHEYPAIRQPDGVFELYKDRHGLVIGGMEDVSYKEYELQLKPGAKLFVYTDGVPEAEDAQKKMFGTERMVNALNEDPDASPEQILKNVLRAVDGFVKDAEQFDDLTMMCVEYRGR